MSLELLYTSNAAPRLAMYVEGLLAVRAMYCRCRRCHCLAHPPSVWHSRIGGNGQAGGGECSDGGKQTQMIQSAVWRWRKQTQNGQQKGSARGSSSADSWRASAALLMPPCSIGFIHSLQALSTASAAEPLRLLLQ